SGRPGARTAEGSPAGRAADRSLGAQVSHAVVGELRGLSRQLGQHEADEVLLRPVPKGWVETPLEADGRTRLAAEALATRGAAEVRREDLDVVRKGEQLAEEAVVELLGLLRLRARAQQVRPPHAAGEERVPGEDEPRFRAPRAVGHEE